MADSLTMREAEIAEQIHREYQPSAGAQALAKMVTHEAVCVIRYDQIIARIGRLEAVVLTAAGGLILSLVGLVGTLLHIAR